MPSLFRNFIRVMWSVELSQLHRKGCGYCPINDRVQSVPPIIIGQSWSSHQIISGVLWFWWESRLYI